MLPTLLAHIGHHDHTGLTAGFLHPFHGWDHLLAMLAVGYWVAVNGWRKGWIYPAIFLLALLFGAMTGLAMNVGSWVEWGILGTLWLLGMALFVQSSNRAAILTLIGVAGLFHGLAHGGELGASATAMAGMFIGSACLHASGFACSLALNHLPKPQIVWRVVGTSFMLAAVVGAAYG